ncbi:MAG: hypothetical protein EXS06_09040 [Planctomycetaceae bacterium]|nr:hypothetical protein [Planctomycetaceae bacterium]
MQVPSRQKKTPKAISSASPTAAAASPKPPPGGGAAKTFAINEAIAVGVLVALAIHGLLRFLGAAVEVPGSPLGDDPDRRGDPRGRASRAGDGGGFRGRSPRRRGDPHECLPRRVARRCARRPHALRGKALEARAVSRAGSVLAALARRMPTPAHRREAGGIVDVALAAVAVGDVVVVFPHEICPVDGEVMAGHGTMDESYLTGEPWRMQKAPETANDVTGEAAGAVVMDSALERVDELFHIGKRLRTIALQSAVGGMAASLVGMGFAAAGLLSPAAGALVQEAIDVVAVLNALRVANDNGQLTDYGNGPDRRGT